MKTHVLLLLVLTPCLADYWKDRHDFIEEEESRMLGSSIVLTEQEQIANTILMGYKLKEYDAGFDAPGIFAPGRHFFNARQDIENSDVFKFIQKTPKGAALHGHDTAIVSEEYIYSLTYSENLYACTVDGRLKLSFFERPNQDRSCNWVPISTLRSQNSNFDEWVRKQLTLYVENPREQYTNINVVWNALNEIFATVTPMLTYKPVFKKHFYQALKELYEDNVMYMEFRGTLPTVYELDGSTYSPLEIAGFYEEVIEEFKKDHPDFLGARFIYGPVRRVDNSTVESYVEIVKALNSQYPNFLAGFDLVGQEDMGLPLSEFIAHLSEIRSEINFFFHAAETNWYGSSTDLNLVDAIMLDTKRIGHGYGLTKHPLVMKIVKEREIAIEVCPISNQVLMLVEDIRNHPASYLISQGFPVVISYDDPSFWSTKGLSYDFYMAFMGIASRNADLRLLKQLSKNSLTYSGLPTAEKAAALKAWENKWDSFISDVVSANADKSGSDRIIKQSVIGIICYLISKALQWLFMF